MLDPNAIPEGAIDIAATQAQAQRIFDGAKPAATQAAAPTAAASAPQASAAPAQHVDKTARKHVAALQKQVTALEQTASEARKTALTANRRAAALQKQAQPFLKVTQFLKTNRTPLIGGAVALTAATVAAAVALSGSHARDVNRGGELRR